MTEFITFKDAAEYLGVAKSTLENYSNGGYWMKENNKKKFISPSYYRDFPKCIRVGNRRKFKRIDLDRWIQRCSLQPPRKQPFCWPTE